MEHCTLALLHEETLLRQSMAQVLAERQRYTVLAQVADPPAFKRAFALGTAPQAVLLSLETAQHDGCAVLHWLATHMSATRVLLLGRHPEPEGLVSSLRAGAHGFHCTRDTMDRLCLVLEHVLQGALHFPSSVHHQLRQMLPAQEHARPAATLPTPTECQCEFLRWVAAPGELTYTEIAQRMRTSRSAIDKLRARIFKRYHIQGKTGLVRLALQLGLAA